jgi:hypothetical protein
MAKHTRWIRWPNAGVINHSHGEHRNGLHHEGTLRANMTIPRNRGDNEAQKVSYVYHWTQFQ